MTISGEILQEPEHEQRHHGLLGRRLFDRGQEVLDEVRPWDLSKGRREVDISLPKKSEWRFEGLFDAPANGVALRVSDGSGCVTFELLIPGNDRRDKHPVFYATNMEFSGDYSTDTRLLTREYQGADFHLATVMYQDENYHTIQDAAELFFPGLRRQYAV